MPQSVSDGSDLDDIASHFISGEAGDFIFHEGDVGVAMFIVQEGEVEILKVPPPTSFSLWTKITRRFHPKYQQDCAQQLSILKVGDFFGELSLLEELPRKESARAVTNYKLLKIDYPTFDLIVQQKPEIAIRMLHKLSERLQESQENSFNSAHISRQVASKLLQNCHSLRIAFTNLAKRASQNVRRLPEKLQRNPQTGLNLQIIPDNNLKESSENPTTQPPQPKTTKIKSPEGVLVHIKTGREFTLHNDAEQSIGRLDRNTSSSTNINFSEFDFNRTLSKRHAIIAGRKDGFHLYEETESRNGSFVNGTRVKPGVSIKLQDGDKVTFGLIETTFKKR